MPYILLVEDNTTDIELIERTLANDGLLAQIDVVDTATKFKRRLQDGQVDLVISDSAVCDLTALDALRIAQQLQPGSGFIVFSDGMDVERAEQARRMGALDWLRKSDLHRLASLVRLALPAKESNKSARIVDDAAHLSLANRSVQRLVQAITQLSMARDIATVQAIVRSAAREITGADGATLVLRDGEQCYYADEDAIAPLWKGQRFPMETCVSGWAMINRRPAIIPDITVDPRIPQDAYRPTFVKSLIMVPIRTEAPIGAIGNYWATPHNPTESDVQFIKALADSAAVALDSVQLYQELEQRVQERTRQLQEANQSLEEFSYFVSHDLRGPIRHIRAFTSIMEAELDVPTPAVRSSLDKINDAAATMSAMLEGLLALARSGAAAIEPMDVDMQAAARTAAQIASEQGGARVRIDINNMPAARGSAILLQQVWTNLLTNAVKFSGRQPAPVVTVGGDIDGDMVRYFVRDNGVGFDMANAPQLFTAFRRLHSAKDYAGTGVGLAIVHRIVVRHGGRVWAESAPGRGATFFFTLPRSVGAEPNK